MAYELIIDWHGYQQAIDRLLTLTEQQLSIYDEDLALLELERPARHEALNTVARAGHHDALRLLVRQPHLLQNSKLPRLHQLLATWGHVACARQSADSFAHFRDSMVLADSRHALIRFDRDQPRAKLLIDEPAELRPYLQRFEDLWNEGADPLPSGTTLGL